MRQRRNRSAELRSQPTTDANRQRRKQTERRCVNHTDRAQLFISERVRDDRKGRPDGGVKTKVISVSSAVTLSPMFIYVTPCHTAITKVDSTLTFDGDAVRGWPFALFRAPAPCAGSRSRSRKAVYIALVVAGSCGAIQRHLVYLLRHAALRDIHDVLAADRRVGLFSAPRGSALRLTGPAPRPCQHRRGVVGGGMHPRAA